MNTNWLNRLTVIVSGASSGMGRALTLRLIRERGCKVIGIGRAEDKMLSLKAELGADADSFTYHLFDVSSLDEWRAFKAALDAEGIAPSLVVNNAGMLPKFDKFCDYTPDYIEKVMRVNFNSCVYSASVFLPNLCSRKGCGMVFTASAAALAPLAGTSAYSASKSAVKALVEAIGEEYRKKVYIGLIMPGFTKTDIFRNQNTDISQSKLIEFFCAPCDKAVNKILRGISKKRKRMVIGFDAHAMNVCYRIAPKTALRLFGTVIKKSKIKLFEDVFNEKDENDK